MNSLSIVIVNWNTGDSLKRCVDSIIESSSCNYVLNDIIIVDNHSKDNSIDFLINLECTDKYMDYKNQRILLFLNPNNIGFSKACNIGAKETESEYILFLNPDMILYKETLDDCFSYINNNITKRLGALGVKLYDMNGTVLRTCSRLPKKRYYLAKCLGINKIIKTWNAFMIEWNHLESRRVEEVIGAFFLVKNEVFQSLNGFDERFFVYYEEVDFCKRLKEQGYYVYYYANTSAIHEGGVSSGQVKDRRLFYELRSRYQYFEKHYGKIASIIMLVLIYLEFLSRFLIMVRNKDGIRNILNAYKWFGEWLYGKRI